MLHWTMTTNFTRINKVKNVHTKIILSELLVLVPVQTRADRKWLMIKRIQNHATQLGVMNYVMNYVMNPVLKLVMNYVM